jgi:acyl carrier protein
MKTETIRRNLYRVFRKTGIPRERIVENAMLNEDLFLDDIDRTCFFYYLETNFNVDIKNDEMIKLESVKDTIEYLQSHCA